MQGTTITRKPAASTKPATLPSLSVPVLANIENLNDKEIMGTTDLAELRRLLDESLEHGKVLFDAVRAGDGSNSRAYGSLRRRKTDLLRITSLLRYRIQNLEKGN